METKRNSNGGNLNCNINKSDNGSNNYSDCNFNSNIN